MKATLTYEGKTVEVEIAEAEARKIFGKPKTGWERAGDGENFYALANTFSGLGFYGIEETGTERCEAHYENGNYFADEQLVKDQARAISLWLRIKRWAAEHCEPVAWQPGDDGWKYKYGIMWSLTDISGERRIRPAIQDSTRQFGNVYFDTEEHAKQCIEEFKDELLWYFTECRDRMDG